MGLLDSIGVARRGIGAASAGINTTSQNVSNASTVGYARRKVLQSTADPIQRRGLWIGSGAQVTGIARASDRLLGMRLVATSGASGKASAMHTTLAAAEGYLDNDGGIGLSDALSGFWDSLSSLTQDPSDPSGRRVAIAAADTVANAISRTAAGFADQIDALDSGVATQLETANAKLVEVASLNRAIGRSSSESGPLDLLDRRDQLVRELGEEIGVTVDFEADGQATLFVGGHAVVSGSEARTLSLSTSSGSPAVYVSAGSGVLQVTSDLAGTLGGELQARATIDAWASDLDTFAVTFADAVNAQHAAGFDATGAAGGAVFTYTATQPAASLAVDTALEDPDLLATAGAATAFAGDGDNLRALLDLESSAVFAGGRTAAQSLTELTSGAGADVRAAESDATSLEEELSDIDALRTSLVSVDTDEEAIRLIEYQTAYRAAARVLSTADEMLRGFLAAVGA